MRHIPPPSPLGSQEIPSRVSLDSLPFPTLMWQGLWSLLVAQASAYKHLDGGRHVGALHGRLPGVFRVGQADIAAVPGTLCRSAAISLALSPWVYGDGAVSGLWRRGSRDLATAFLLHQLRIPGAGCRQLCAQMATSLLAHDLRHRLGDKSGHCAPCGAFSCCRWPAAGSGGANRRC